MRIARVIVVIAVGVALAVFGPDRRRAPGVEAALAARIGMHEGPFFAGADVKCVRAEGKNTYLCDVLIHNVEVYNETPFRALVVAPSSSPNL